MKHPEKIQELAPSLGRMVRHFRPFIRKQRVLICGSFAALFAEIGLRLLEPWPLKLVFDHLIAPSGHSRRSFNLLPMNIDSSGLLILAALAVVMITGLRALASYYNTIGFALVGNRVLTDIRKKIYDRLQELSLSFHTKARSGDLIVRVISDVGMLQDVAVTALLPLMGSLFILVGMVGLMLWFNWELTALVLLISPLFWISTSRLSRQIQQVSRVQRTKEGAMAATAAESIGAIKNIQALSLQGTFAASFNRANEKSFQGGVKTKRLAASLERSVDVLIAVGTALVLWFGTRLVLSKELTPGDLIVFLAYLKNAFKPLQDFAKYIGRIAKAAAAGERVVDLLETVPEVRDLPGAVEAPVFAGSVRFENTSFSYEPERSVVKGMSFEVKPGQHTALVGASGAGKSTLVNLLLRLYDPDEGRIVIDGRDIRAYTVDSLRRQISVVLQDSLLFASSIRENISCGSNDVTQEEIECAARLANAHEFILSLPQGYDTVLGERGVTLSSGQRQRIAIARTAIRKSPILILDEPTTGLDEENQQAVIEALERLSENRTTFLITHDLRHASRCDLIFFLEDGCLTEQGSHEDLIAKDLRYATLFKLQTGPQSAEGYAFSR